MRKIKISLLVVLAGVLLTACGENSAMEENNSGADMKHIESDAHVLKNMALGVALTPIKITKEGYSFELRTDGETPKDIAKESTVIWGKSSVTGDEIVSFEVHNGYDKNTQFQVLVKDETGKIVGSSEFIPSVSGADDIEYEEVIVD